MVVTLGQQYNVGEKPTVILYTANGIAPPRISTYDWSVPKTRKKTCIRFYRDGGGGGGGKSVPTANVCFDRISLRIPRRLGCVEAILNKKFTNNGKLILHTWYTVPLYCELRQQFTNKLAFPHDPLEG